MYASTIDEVDWDLDNGDVLYNRQLVPPLKIGRSQLCLRGKQYALLWQLHLVGAATYEDLIRLSEQVACITSDMGTERLLAEAGDVVEAFCRVNSIAVPPLATPRQRTFPNALVCPGVQHILDNLLRRWCTSMEWFRQWLAKAKSLLKLLREYNEDTVRCLKRRKLDAAVEVVQAARAPYFAAWRWQTLYRATKCVAQVWPVLALHWKHMGFARQIEDHTLARSCEQALTDNSFAALATIVLSVAEKFVEMAGWAQGCECHQDC